MGNLRFKLRPRQTSPRSLFFVATSRVLAVSAARIQTGVGFVDQIFFLR